MAFIFTMVYKTNLISTIVDSGGSHQSGKDVYKTNLISTIVDSTSYTANQSFVYKTNLISTIVDYDSLKFFILSSIRLI